MRKFRLSSYLPAVAILAFAMEAAPQEADRHSDGSSLFSDERTEIAFQYFDAIMQIPAITVAVEEAQEREFKRDMAAAIISSFADRIGDRNHRPSHEEVEGALDWLYSAYGRIADKYYGNNDGREERAEIEHFNKDYRNLTGLEDVIYMIRFRRMNYHIFNDRWYQVEP